jgi:transposase
MTISGVGPITAQAIVTTVRETSAFASGREFAASLGLTPRQNSTGGKERLGRITKMGDRYLRKLLVVGACATLRHRTGHNDALRVWADRLLARKSVKYKFKLTAVALANKVARIVFALMKSHADESSGPAGLYPAQTGRRHDRTRDVRKAARHP